MTKDLQTLEEAISKLFEEINVDLVDLELRQGALCVTVSRLDGLDLESLTTASRAVSDLLDEHEELAPNGTYELEVSSPGLERRLRKPEHFIQVVGQTIAVRTSPGAPGSRRFEGILTRADSRGISITPTDAPGERVLAYNEIDRAHTVFDWKAALAQDKRVRASEEDLQNRSARTTDGPGANLAQKLSRENTR